jgi:predicted metal-dependent enzyme (double-stranded beta helix superfamily)
VLSVDEIVEDCLGLLTLPDVEHVVAGYVSQLLRDRSPDVIDLLGASMTTTVLHRSPELTVAKVVVPPLYELHPHGHLMWAVVGTVAGREDNTFFIRAGERLVPVGGASYDEGQVGILNADVIHSVRNPTSAHTVGLHVYGGDLLGDLGPLGRAALGGIGLAEEGDLSVGL